MLIICLVGQMARRHLISRRTKCGKPLEPHGVNPPARLIDTPVADNSVLNPLAYHSGPPQPCGNKHTKGQFRMIPFGFICGLRGRAPRLPESAVLSNRSRVSEPFRGTTSPHHTPLSTPQFYGQIIHTTSGWNTKIYLNSCGARVGRQLS
jgi:hypothetical protein